MPCADWFWSVSRDEAVAACGLESLALFCGSLASIGADPEPVDRAAIADIGFADRRLIAGKLIGKPSLQRCKRGACF